MFLSRRSRRLAFATAVIITLSSCGSAQDNSASQPTATSTTRATTPKPAVIHVAAGGALAAGEATAADAKSSDESRMSMAAAFNFVYGGDIIDLTAPAASWFFAPGVMPTAEAVQQVARAFGIEGELRELSGDKGGGWVVGSDDYAEPSVMVGADSTLGWWYNPGDSGQSVSSCEVISPELPIDEVPADPPTPEPASTDGGPVTAIAVDPICEEPEPPANVPTAEAAETKAAAMLTALGLQPADYEFETYADAWGASVTAYLLLDGIRTPLSINVGYGAEGAITWAGGFLATPQRGADYPRIGIEASVQRLNDQNTGWMYGSVGASGAEAGTSDGSTGVDQGAVTDGPPDGPTEIVDPKVSTELVQPPESQPPDFEPVTVTLTNARPSIEMLWAADNTVWLLPGYAFDSTENGVFSVIAVEDQYIDIAVDPVGVPEPTPPVTDPPTVIEPAPPAPVDPVDPIDPAECPQISSPIPGDAPASPTETIESVVVESGAGGELIGLCIDDATAVALTMGFVVRAVRIDGVDQAVTMDFLDNRLNVAVENGIVTAVISIG